MKQIFSLFSVFVFTCFLSACITTAQKNNLSYQYAKESFVKQDYTQAFKLVQKPAKSGNADAQYALGYMYYYGKGVESDRQQARYWFKLAAEQGQQQAQTALARMQS